MIFVFGSNLAGRHGKGAALYAKDHYGAIYGIGEGIQGNSYAIPTKDERIQTRSLSDVVKSVQTFIMFATTHPEMDFDVTKVGCGLAGFQEEDIALKGLSAPRLRDHPIQGEQERSG